MPIYEYECDTCGFVVEEFFPVIPLEVPSHLDKSCDRCMGKSFRKTISAPNFHLKGTCWAKDGYSMQYQDGSRVVSITEPDE